MNKWSREMVVRGSAVATVLVAVASIVGAGTKWA
jgi:hypothetical protein